MKYIIIPLIGILLIIALFAYRVLTLVYFALHTFYSYLFDTLWHFEFPAMTMKQQFYSRLYFKHKNIAVVTYYTSLTDYVFERKKDQLIQANIWENYKSCTAYELFMTHKKLIYGNG